MLTAAEEHVVDLASALKQRDTELEELKRELAKARAEASGYLMHLWGAQTTIAQLRAELDLRAIQHS